MQMHQNDQTYLNNRTSILKATANKIQNHQNDQKKSENWSKTCKSTQNQNTWFIGLISPVGSFLALKISLILPLGAFTALAVLNFLGFLIFWHFECSNVSLVWVVRAFHFLLFLGFSVSCIARTSRNVVPVYIQLLEVTKTKNLAWHTLRHYVLRVEKASAAARTASNERTKHWGIGRMSIFSVMPTSSSAIFDLLQTNTLHCWTPAGKWTFTLIGWSLLGWLARGYWLAFMECSCPKSTVTKNSESFCPSRAPKSTSISKQSWSWGKSKCLRSNICRWLLTCFLVPVFNSSFRSPNVRVIQSSTSFIHFSSIWSASSEASLNRVKYEPRSGPLIELLWWLIHCSVATGCWMGFRMQSWSESIRSGKLGNMFQANRPKWDTENVDSPEMVLNSVRFTSSWWFFSWLGSKSLIKIPPEMCKPSSSTSRATSGTASLTAFSGLRKLKQQGQKCDRRSLGSNHLEQTLRCSSTAFGRAKKSRNSWKTGRANKRVAARTQHASAENVFHHELCLFDVSSTGRKNNKRMDCSPYFNTSAEKGTDSSFSTSSLRARAAFVPVCHEARMP